MAEELSRGIDADRKPTYDGSYNSLKSTEEFSRGVQQSCSTEEFNRGSQQEKVHVRMTGVTTPSNEPRRLQGRISEHTFLITLAGDICRRQHL